MWSMTDVGDDGRCDHSSCPMRTTDCESIYCVFGGDKCTVVCADNPKGKKEIRECVGDDEWKTIGAKLDCKA